jgi:hypothetical protein
VPAVAERRRLGVRGLVVAATLVAGGLAAAAPGARPVPTPAADLAGASVCADVGVTRVCWADAPRAVARTAPPAAAATPMGWRCWGAGAKRVCVDRGAAAPAFACDGPRCRQRHARLPDDGEWTCVDDGGAVVCVGASPPAGVVAGPVDAGWLCGERHAGRRPELGGRVCVDLSPDVPDGELAAWSCRVENGAAPTRVCERAAAAHGLGAACDAHHPCVDGASCLAGRCAPAKPSPTCTLDDDCGFGACRFGTCRSVGAP